MNDPENIELKALIVEDTMEDARNFGQVLEDSKFEVDYATTKDEAKKRLSDSVYNLIFLDIQLPMEDDGLEVLEFARMTTTNEEDLQFCRTNPSKNSNTPIVIISIRDDYRAFERANKPENNIFEYLVKPIYIDVLRKVIKDVLTNLHS